MEERIRVFIVDDHEMVRVGLRRMLEMEDDLEVVGEAGSADEALGLVEVLSPNVILMDIKMPNVNGIDATRHLKSRGIQGEIIVLSLYEEYLAQAIEAGATGYLVKDVKREELVDAIRRAAQGNLVLGGSLATSSDITERTIGYLRDMLRKNGAAPSPGVEGDQRPHNQATGPADMAGHSDQSLSPSQYSLPLSDAAGPASAGPHEGGREVGRSLREDGDTTGMRFGSPSSGRDTRRIPRIPVVRRRVGEGPQEQTLQAAPSLLPGFLEMAGTQVPVSPSADPEEREAALLKELELRFAQQSGAADLFEGDVELVITAPVEANALLKLHQWLKGMLKVEVEETYGSWDGDTSLRVLLRRPTPLVKMLETIPEVIEAMEEHIDPGLKGRRFLKRRKDMPNPSVTPLRRIRLALDSPFIPKQLMMGLE